MLIHLLIKKEIYRNYFTSIFPQDDQGHFLINRETDLGKFICAMVRYSDYPVKDPVPEESIWLKLPTADSLRIGENRFLYFDREDIIRINDLIEVCFNIDFDRYYLAGVKAEFQKKEIFESFIVSRNLVNLMSDNEQIKKREYRSQMDLFRERVKQLRNMALYRDSKIKIEPGKILQK